MILDGLPSISKFKAPSPSLASSAVIPSKLGAWTIRVPELTTTSTVPFSRTICPGSGLVCMILLMSTRSLASFETIFKFSLSFRKSSRALLTFTPTILGIFISRGFWVKNTTKAMITPNALKKVTASKPNNQLGISPSRTRFVFSSEGSSFGFGLENFSLPADFLNFGTVSITGELEPVSFRTAGFFPNRI